MVRNLEKVQEGLEEVYERLGKYEIPMDSLVLNWTLKQYMRDLTCLSTEPLVCVQQTNPPWRKKELFTRKRTDSNRYIIYGALLWITERPLTECNSGSVSCWHLLPAKFFSLSVLFGFLLLGIFTFGSRERDLLLQRAGVGVLTRFGMMLAFALEIEEDETFVFIYFFSDELLRLHSSHPLSSVKHSKRKQNT